ncbi:purine catabolism regulatory family protein [Scopulibacillus darangshiensis]|uniref:Purine catabolism regulatory family protein n=1 Tax=Scopulibacillus darangshiensis TaxID=442528 RepID=A0A4R2NW11_9BACL|nr:PucR family transcriptional regulator ligand-binding domain-containing protein [Scopulibacillus darangshiensis]TCP25605.1 purine catabolism regulatory family protein [Scopulibacillus darangshiensis]
MITVNRLLENLNPYDVRLISGQGGVDKPLEYINIQEFALRSERIKKNGVILTTFTSFLESGNIIEHLQWLSSKEIRAIGIHTVFIKDIPEEVIHFSNANDFPIFLLPEDMSYQQIMQIYSELLMEDANTVRLELEQRNISMLRAVALDKDSQYIISIMGKHLNLPIIHLDKSLNMKSYWSASYFSKTDIQDVVDKLLLEQKDAMCEEITIDYKPLTGNGGHYSFKSLPIMDSKSSYGALVIGMENDFSLSDWSVINYGKTALLLDSVKRNSVEKYLKNKDMKIIESILEPPKKEAINFHDLSAHFKQPCHIYLIATDNSVALNRAFEALYNHVEKWEPDALIWIYDNQIICFLKSKSLSDILTDSSETFKDVYCGVSEKSESANADSIQEKYEQAKLGLEIGKARKTMINEWDSLGYDKCLFTLSQKNILQRSAKSLLAPLIEHDKTFDSELIATLAVYLNTYFSLKKSAEQLFVHKNTVKYRISKIKELYKGVNFEDPETYLLFSSTLRLYEIEKNI